MPTEEFQPANVEVQDFFRTEEVQIIPAAVVVQDFLRTEEVQIIPVKLEVQVLSFVMID